MQFNLQTGQVKKSTERLRNRYFLEEIMSSFADDAEPNAKECSQMVKLLDDMRFMQ